MKTVFKTAALLLAVAVLISMATAVFAAGSGSITVENPAGEETYTAYKIFDVVYKDDKSAYSYTIAADSEWLTAVQSYAGISLSDAVTDGEGNTFHIVTENDDFSAATFANVLKSAVAGKTGIELNLAEGKAVATGLDLGYYFVAGTGGALCNLTTTDPDAVIYDKNDIPFEKTADDVSVEVGQKVNFTLTGKVPDTTGFSSYVYEISDTMTEGLTFNKDVQVYVDGVLLTEHVTVTNMPTDADATGFVVSMDVMQLQNLVGKQITVTYSALINEKAVSTVQENNAELKYSNDPTDAEKFDKIPDDVKLYTAKIVIDKFETGDEDKKLAGAEFVLMNAQGQFYAYDAEAKAVSWVTEQNGATVVTTDDNGSAAFIGLEDGIYTLKEIKAPTGYNLLTDTMDIPVAGSDADGVIQPAQEILITTQSLEHSLEQVGMGGDKAGKHDLPCRVNHAGGRVLFHNLTTAYSGDAILYDGNTGICIHLAAGIHGKKICIFNDDICFFHPAPPFRAT